MARGTERGFVLVSALWLLLLGGSLAALLTLRAITSARDLAFDDRAHAEAGLADAAVETVAADLLFRGAGSRWGRPPASGSLAIGGRVIAVSARPEAGLPDVNDASPAVLAEALASLPLSQPTRDALLSRIVGARTVGRIGSLLAVAALGHGIMPKGSEPCLAAILSPFRPSGIVGPAIGSLTRIVTGDGPGRQAFVLRLIAAGDRPYAIADAYALACPLAIAPASA